MITVSVVFHVVALGLATLWGGFYSPPSRFLSVTVVDLVGGEAFAPPPRKPARPVEEPAPPPPEKSVKEEKEPGAPPPVTVKAKEKSKAKDAPDAGALAKSLGKIREKRASEERLREAVVAIRREKAARKAIRQIGERVGRRIDLSSVQPAPKSAPSSPTAGLPGATGNARVPPEHLAYFRKLDEKIRSNWNVPALTAGERENLMVRIRIVIEQDGRVSQVRMEKTSGNTYFDDSVRRAINKASPLPVPPEQLRGGEDHYEVGFRFYGAGGGS
ncbi:MAG: cell envelope integrity protein TolA [Deltaproteobacteria bacterium]|nr:cell envelope integrity protein TolA [Deltaproteobacteria bacterium]